MNNKLMSNILYLIPKRNGNFCIIF